MKGIDAEHTRSSLGICTSEASSWEDGDGACETQVVWSRQTSSRETNIRPRSALRDPQGFSFCQVE